MAKPEAPYPHESIPVSKTRDDQLRNADLLSGYDYSRYAEALTGYTGQDLQRVGFIRWEHAVRTRVGPRGNYKAGMTRTAAGLGTGTIRSRWPRRTASTSAGR